MKNISFIFLLTIFFFGLFSNLSALSYFDTIKCSIVNCNSNPTNNYNQTTNFTNSIPIPIPNQQPNKFLNVLNNTIKNPTTVSTTPKPTIILKNENKNEGCIFSKNVCEILTGNGVTFTNKAEIVKPVKENNNTTDSKLPDVLDQKDCGDYCGVKTLKEYDGLTGIQSPNYDSHEPSGRHDNSENAVESRTTESQINQSAQSFNSNNTFVQRGTGECANWGMTVGGSCPNSENYKNGFKMTTANLCRITGKSLNITSGNRSPSCNKRVGGASNSSHMGGKAMDTNFLGYSDDEKTVLVLYFIANGFNNIGGYGSNKAIHMDYRNSVNRWGPNYSITSCSSNRFPDYTRKAFSLIGLQPCSRDTDAPSKAVQALKKLGKTNFLPIVNTESYSFNRANSF
jgi:hypothetical protein